MSPHKPPLPKPPRSDSDALRDFTERAALVLAGQRAVNAQSWVLLSEIAEEVGLPRDELEPAVRSILLDGPPSPPRSSPPSAPPPLPSNAPPSPPQFSSDDAFPAQQSGGAAPPPIYIGPDDDSASPPPFLPGESEGGRDRDDPGDRVEKFKEMAIKLVAEQGGFTGQCHALLFAASRELGLTDEQHDEAVRSLWPSMGAGVGDPQEAPPPAPTPPEPVEIPPAEKFGAYLNKAFESLSSNRINQRRERRLIEEGVKKLGLSEAFARHLLVDLAYERGLAVASVEQKKQELENVKADPLVQSFLQRAAPVIAVERGVNSRSMVKLRALADELGLNESQRQFALKTLNGAQAEPSHEQTHQVAKSADFCQHLREVLPKLPHSILTGVATADLVQTAAKRFGLEEEEARVHIRSVAEELGLRIVNEQQVSRRLESLVDDALGGSFYLDTEARERLYAVGVEWGLTEETVEQVIRDRVASKRAAHSQNKKSRTTIIAACAAVAGVLAAAALVLLAGQSALNRTAKNESSQDAAPPVETREPSDAATVKAAPKTWMDEDLLESLAAVRLHRELSDTLNELKKPEAPNRAVAYHQLVDRTVSSSSYGARAIQELLAGCHALDPSDENAEKMREQLVRLSVAPVEPLPHDAQTLDRGLSALQTLVSFWGRDGLGEQRAQQLAEDIERASNVNIDTSFSRDQVSRQVFDAVFRRWYELLAKLADSSRSDVPRLLAVIGSEARRHFDGPAVDTLESLEVEFLVEALPKVTFNWAPYLTIIQRCTTARDPLNVLKVLKLFERTEDGRLLGEMAPGLLRRAGVTSDPDTREEAARLIRAGLGVDVVEQAERGHRRQSFADDVDKVQKTLSAEADDAEELLEETIELVYYSTLACALSQAELGETTYEELETEGPPKEMESLAPAGVRRSRTAADISRNTLDHYFNIFKRATNFPARREFLRAVAELSADLDDIDVDRASELAKYFLRPKPAHEQLVVLDVLPKLARWRQIKLSLADKLATSDLKSDWLIALVEAATDRELNPPNEARLRDYLYTELLKDVLEDMGPPQTGSNSAAADNLLHYLTQQCRLLGAPVEAGESGSVSSLVRALIDRQAVRLSGKSLRAADAAYLADLERHIKVAEYLGETDVSRTALLDRIWLKLLAMELVAERPVQEGQADEIVQQLRQSDRDAENVLVQLRDGKSAILQIWTKMVAP